MPALDVFNGDAFSLISLSAAVNKLPFLPSTLGSMNLFVPKGIRTTTALFEEHNGKLSLIQSKARGSQGDIRTQEGRTARNIPVPHVPLFQTIMADDIQNVRAFGSESELEALASVVNDQLTGMRQNHETTHEWHRAGAIHGVIQDADGTTLINLFTEFGQSETNVDFDFATGAADIKQLTTTVIRAVEDNLGATNYGVIVGFCGNTFWDNLVSNEDVTGAYERFQDGQFLREQQRPTGFMFGGIEWQNYRGQIGSEKYIDDTVCRFVVTGVGDLFQEVMAPADFTETVNTTGQLMYAKQKQLDFDKGVQLHTQSNVLYVCTRPEVLIKGTDVTV